MELSFLRDVYSKVGMLKCHKNVVTGWEFHRLDEIMAFIESLISNI